MTAPQLIVGETPAQVAERAASAFLERAREALDAQDLVHICLTGGSMGKTVLERVSEDPDAAALDWSRLHFWWGDDRFVPAGDADRNAGQSRAALLDAMPVPPQNIHEMAPSDTGLSLDEAAEAYAAELARHGSDEHPWPSFTICFLGMGPDGHIASLFPERAELAEQRAAALPVRESPKPPPARVTLTLPVIGAAAAVWLVVTGADKAPALAAALRGDAGVPAGLVRGRAETLVFADAAAAG